MAQYLKKKIKDKTIINGNKAIIQYAEMDNHDSDNDQTYTEDYE